MNLEQNVTFHGFVSDVVENLKDMDVFIIPSLYGEGLPMVLLESMSVGLPVIASNIDGIPEVVTHMQNGLLFNSNDHEALRSLIELMHADEKLMKKLSNEAIHTQQDSFSVETMARKINELYEN
jgi:glycosyltransferase involved in cell wall biosynthesis